MCCIQVNACSEVQEHVEIFCLYIYILIFEMYTKCEQFLVIKLRKGLEIEYLCTYILNYTEINKAFTFGISR